MRLIRMCFLLATIAAVTAACEFSPRHEAWPEVSRHDTFAITDVPTLVVKDFNGSVKVYGGMHDQHVNVVAELRRPDRVAYEAVQNGNTVSVTARGIGLWADFFPRGRQANIEVIVPRSSNVHVRAENGTISLRNVNGAVELAAFNGAIRAVDVEGVYDITTSNGQIKVDDGRGTFNIRTYNGGISFQGELARGTDNRFKTSNGNITTLLEGGPVSLSVDAETSNGDIVMGSALSVASATRHKNRLSAVIGDGDTDLTLTTSNGSIYIE